MNAPSPRSLPPNKPLTRRYSAEAVTVATLLHASGHAPNGVVLRTLLIVHRRNLTLSFGEFLAGCSLALTMSEEARAKGGHA
jgi:hypothetical protein